MSYGYNKSAAGNRKKSKTYKVVCEEEINPNAPPAYITFYYLEFIASGKRLNIKFINLEDAEKECEQKNNEAQPD